MKKSIPIIPVCFFCLLGLFLHAQQSRFSEVINRAQAYAIKKTADQNYLIAGQWDDAALVLKIDAAGSVLWSKTLGNAFSCFYSLAVTSDSGSVLAGYSHNTSGATIDIFCVKTNANGDTLWTRTIDMGSDEKAYSIKQTADHGFILTGDQDMTKLFVVKLDSNGNFTWGKLYTAGSLENMATGIEQAPDSGYVLTGLYENYPPPDIGMLLMKISGDGSVSWAKRQVAAGTNYAAFGYDIHVAPDGILSYSNIGDAGLTLIKTDHSGNFLWGKSYGTSWDSNLGPKQKLFPTHDGGYAFAYGNLFSAGGMIKVDSLGNLLLYKFLFFSAADIVESNDGGYLSVGNGPLIGVKERPAYLSPQIGIIKTDSLGNADMCTETHNAPEIAAFPGSLQDVAASPVSAGTITHFVIPFANVAVVPESGCVDMSGGIRESNLEPIPIDIFPNPSEGVFRVTIKCNSGDELKWLEVCDMLGERVYGSQDPSVLQKPFDFRHVPDGIYSIKAVFSRSIAFGKLIIRK